MTEKKLKAHLHRIWYHYNRLRIALNEAHRIDIIQYDADYNANAPCFGMDIVRDRVKKTTQKAIAECITDGIRDKI